MDMNLSKLREWVMKGSLVCCSPWGLKELNTTEQLNGKMSWDEDMKILQCDAEELDLYSKNNMKH